MAERRDYNIMIKNDGKFYVGYCLEIPQARGQGSTRDEAIQYTMQAIKLCNSYLENKRKSSDPKLLLWKNLDHMISFMRIKRQSII